MDINHTYSSAACKQQQS